MADLVSSSQVTDYLGLTAADPVALDLADRVESLLAEQCGRADRPFAAATASRTEVHDGTGTTTLWLDYPLAALTSIKLGVDPSLPVETLAVADLDVLSAVVGLRQVFRRDGVFGPAGKRRYVQVVYDHGEDLPNTGGQAVLEMTAALWRRKGLEGVTSERLGGYAVTFAGGDGEDLAESLPVWRAFVQSHGVLV